MFRYSRRLDARLDYNYCDNVKAIIPDNTKLRGGYYTYPQLADWICQWAIRSANDRILEPSCGDGVFLSAAGKVIQKLGTSHVAKAARIVGVEICEEEAAKARKSNKSSVKVVCSDFFEWFKSTRTRFDVAVGNPPFIRYQNFPEDSRSKAIEILDALRFRSNRLTNIWVPFIVASAEKLERGGRLAMIVPAELLQVSYAGQLRDYLTSRFDSLSVVTCNEMFFPSAEQEVVVIAAEGKRDLRDEENPCRVRVVETATVDSLLKIPLSQHVESAEEKTVCHTTEKWLKYLLTQHEIDFMRSMRDHEKVDRLGAHASIDVGVVTGKNEFFVLSQSEIDEFGLQKYAIPLVGRSSHLQGTIITRSEHKKLSRNNDRVFLLDLNGVNPKRFHSKLKRFIKLGETAGHHLGYKCSIRKAWFNVPSIWTPDCFLFRQIYDFPRAVLNKTTATSTDTIHRMKCGGDPERVASNLYTYLTAASAEIQGRSYGGGVLELEPTEAENLLMPKNLNGALPLKDADALVRKGKLKDVLDANDDAVLQRSLGLSKSDCTLLKNVWIKMRDRRLNRKRRQSPASSTS